MKFFFFYLKFSMLNCGASPDVGEVVIDVLGREPLEAEDDGPDHAQRHLDVAVHDLLGADRHQLHALRSDEVQRLNGADNKIFKLQVEVGTKWFGLT